MSIAAFLSELVTTGRTRVGATFPPAPEGEPLFAALRQLDARARADAPLAAPPFGPDAARWGARALYVAAQALTLRHLPGQAVAAELARPCPGTPSPGRSWSVDLCLRWLPDLAELARALPEGDPLPELLRELGRAWPLSSCGLVLAPERLDAAELAAVQDDPCLSRLHADRAIARRDLARLSEPRTRELARVAIGDHPELCPSLGEERRA